eukprot:TRINITY_DN55778_c0_g1_i1.p1 TRINITY_DN55778_c0_g1~~TRINITY_DN55778_c0_g1_i1.p1  ORF type:complete len:434 (+),score=92.73 TRINITY_DN55778_c0_g1_i1:82-1302(+)
MPDRFLPALPRTADAQPLPTVVYSAAVRQRGAATAPCVVNQPRAHGSGARLLRRPRRQRTSPRGQRRRAPSLLPVPQKRIPTRLATTVPAVAMLEPPAPGAVPPEPPEFRELVHAYITSLDGNDSQAMQRLKHLRALAGDSFDDDDGDRPSASMQRKPSLPPSLSPSSHLSLTLPPTSPYARQRQYVKAQVVHDFSDRKVVDLRGPPRQLVLPWEHDPDRSVSLEEEEDPGLSPVPYPQNPFMMTRSPANPSRDDVYLSIDKSVLKTRDLGREKKKPVVTAEGERSPRHAVWVEEACRATQRVAEQSRAALCRLVEHCEAGRPQCPTQAQLQRASNHRHTKERQRERRQAKQRLRQAQRNNHVLPGLPAGCAVSTPVQRDCQVITASERTVSDRTEPTATSALECS